MNGWIIVALLQPIRFLTFFALFLSQGDWLQEQVTSNNCHSFPIVDTISLPFSFQAWWWMHWFFVVIQILVCSFFKIFFWISQWCISRYQCLFSKQWRKGGRRGCIKKECFHNISLTRLYCYEGVFSLAFQIGLYEGVFSLKFQLGENLRGDKLSFPYWNSGWNLVCGFKYRVIFFHWYEVQTN